MSYQARYGANGVFKKGVSPMDRISGATRILVQFKLPLALSSYKFPQGFNTSIELAERAARRFARPDATDAERFVSLEPVCPTALRRTLASAGFILVAAKAQQRSSRPEKGGKPYTMITCTFECSSKELPSDVTKWFDELASKYWSKYSIFLNKGGTLVNVLFAEECRFPVTYELLAPDEFGCARVRNLRYARDSRTAK